MQVPADSASGKDSLLDLQSAALSLCAHMTCPECVLAERTLVSPSSYEGTSSVRLEPYPMTPLTLN